MKRLEKAGANAPNLPKKEKSEEKYQLLARYSSVTIWPRVQSALGLNLPLPVVMPFCAAHKTVLLEKKGAVSGPSLLAQWISRLQRVIVRRTIPSLLLYCAVWLFHISVCSTLS